MSRVLFAVLVLVCVSVCRLAGQVPAPAPVWKVEGAGMLTDSVLNEVSGMALSRLDPDRFWVLNDSGNKASLHAISSKGELLGSLELEKTKNRDWEDLASFVWEGRNYLLVADVGDNGGRRKDCCLYLVEEPATLSASAKGSVVAVIPFSYEDGPKDVESIAVDAAAGKILLLSKREKITGLYELPLVKKSPEAPLIAKKVAGMESLPRPTDKDRTDNPMAAPYLGQPTGMDISGDKLAVLTYQEVFLYSRNPKETWADAVLRGPEVLPRHHLLQAEAICFSQDGQSIFVATERKGTAPMLRYTSGR